MAEKFDAEMDDGSVYTEVNGARHQIACGEPVYRCSNIESYAIKTASYGRANAVQSIWLESKQLINPENVLKALFIVSRQVPHLQFCCMKRRNKLWFKRMEKLDIDFETSAKEPLEIHYDMIDTMFDLFKGPLWKVRLNLQCSSNKNALRKYSAFLTVCLHHSITDATANMKICRDLISILNKMSVGEQVIPVFSPVCPTMDIATLEIHSVTYVVWKAWKKIFSSIIRNFGIQSSFNGVLPIPKSKSTVAKFNFHDFSKSETDAILKLCKVAEITINSFMIAVANFALLGVAQSRSKHPIGPRKMVTLQAINMRRYFEPQHKDSSGCHVSYLEDEFKMALSDAKDFWSVAKKIHLSIKKRVEVTKEPVKNIPLIPLSFKIVPINHFLISNGYRNRTLCHYFTTNMGNLKDLLPGPKEEDDIEITNLLRGNGGPFCGAPIVLSFHTFRGRLLISVDYSVNLMEDDVANAFLNRLIKYMKNLINNIELK